MIRKAIIPAAGLGTRFLPATKAQPKEMLPVVDKPVIQYLVEEAVASGIEQIIIVTGRDKRPIEDHFDQCFELEYALQARGKLDLLKKVRAVTNLAKFIYVRQPEPRGDGDAILRARDIVGDEPCAVLFGDDIVDAKVPCIRQLMRVYEKFKSPVIALQKVPLSRVSAYGVVAVKSSRGKEHRISALVEKPEPQDAPSNLAIVGKYIITPAIFKALEKVNGGNDGEIRLIDGFREFVKRKPLYGLEFEGKRYDTGDKFGFLKASIDFALKRPELKSKLMQYLKKIVDGSDD